MKLGSTKDGHIMGIKPDADSGTSCVTCQREKGVEEGSKEEQIFVA